MAIQVQGSAASGGSTVAADPTFAALRVSPRPLEFGVFGCYAKALSSGTMAAGLAANANVFSFRWGDATRLGIIARVTAGAGSIGAFAAGFSQFVMKLGRSFSASHTGGTAGTITGNNGKLRTTMGTTLLTDVRVASTAALGGGTVTLDTDGIAAATYSVSVTAGDPVIPPTLIFNNEAQTEYPIVFAQNEGFVLQATVPATGTWTFSVDVKWYEVASY